MEPGNGTPPGDFDHFDILQFWVGNETLNELEIGLRLKELAQPVPTIEVPFVSREAGIAFLFGKASHQVQYNSDNPFCGGYMYSTFRNASYQATYGRCVATTVEPSEGIVRFHVPRPWILNDTYVTFGSGHRLEGLYAETTAGFPLNIGLRAGVRVYDRAPDAGQSPVYDSALGNVTSHGSVRLSTPEPIRLSNGESTTLVYPLTIFNEGARDDAIHLEIENAEPAWTLRAPPRVNVRAGESVTVPVILSMGFEHRHGEIAYFLVRAQSASDPASWSSLHLGVFWLDVPQPAGHHNRMWLHSGPASATPSGGYAVGLGVGASLCFSNRAAWFNPLETDEAGGAEDGPVPACPGVSSDPLSMVEPLIQPSVSWTVPLNPALLLGIDFDLSQEGSFSTAVRTPLAAPDGVLSFELQYCDTKDGQSPSTVCPGVWLPIARARSAPTSLSAGGETGFLLEFPLEEAADLLPYQRNSNLRIALRLSASTPLHPPSLGGPGLSPELVVKGSELVLPLVEYHDPIDQAFQHVGSLVLRPLGPFEKPANPGQTISFPFELANLGSDPQEVALSLEGHNSPWGRLPRDEASVGAGAKMNVSLIVDVPADASEGERAELFLVAESRDDPNVVAVSRLRAAVFDPATLVVPPEEAYVLDDSSGAPGVGLLGVAVALLAVVLVRRKHS